MGKCSHTPYTFGRCTEPISILTGWCLSFLLQNFRRFAYLRAVISFFDRFCSAPMGHNNSLSLLTLLGTSSRVYLENIGFFQDENLPTTPLSSVSDPVPGKDRPDNNIFCQTASDRPSLSTQLAHVIVLIHSISSLLSKKTAVHRYSSKIMAVHLVISIQISLSLRLSSYLHMSIIFIFSIVFFLIYSIFIICVISLFINLIHA